MLVMLSKTKMCTCALMLPPAPREIHHPAAPGEVHHSPPNSMPIIPFSSTPLPHLAPWKPRRQKGPRCACGPLLLFAALPLLAGVDSEDERNYVTDEELLAVARVLRTELDGAGLQGAGVEPARLEGAGVDHVRNEQEMRAGGAVGAQGQTERRPAGQREERGQGDVNGQAAHNVPQSGQQSAENSGTSSTSLPTQHTPPLRTSPTPRTPEAHVEVGQMEAQWGSQPRSIPELARGDQPWTLVICEPDFKLWKRPIQGSHIFEYKGILTPG